MTQSFTEITVFFDEPFWVALFEQHQEGFYCAARKVIGTSEPMGVELMDFFNRLNLSELSFSDPVKEEKAEVKTLNFKRQIRQAKQIQHSLFKFTFTKAHACIKAQQAAEQQVLAKKAKMETEEKKQIKFELKQAKRKQKHRGH